MSLIKKVKSNFIILIISFGLIGLSFGMSVNILSAQEVKPASGGIGFTFRETFPDSNLAQLVAVELGDGNIDSILTQEMVDSCIYLYAGNKGIQDVSGIEVLEQLTSLNLSANQLTTVPESISGLRYLEDLNLTNNKLTSLPNTIGDLVSLRTLKLSDNELVMFPDSIGYLNKLIELDASQNLLTNIPDSIGDLDALLNLNLSFNQIVDVPSSIGDLSSIERLSLHFNNLTRLPDSIGNLNALQLLVLNANQLTSLPDSIGNLSSLHELYATINMLTELPVNFVNLTSLQVLNLYDNQLANLPDNFENLISLQVLNLQVNEITGLPNNFSDLTSLKKLYMSNNLLTRLPDNFGNLISLEELYLDSNQLTSLPTSFGDLDALKKLSLSRNLLPTNYQNDLNSIGLPIVVNYEIQSSLILNGVIQIEVQSEENLKNINLFDFVAVKYEITNSKLSSAHNLVLENLVDENNDSVSFEDYIKNGIVQKNGTVFAQIRSTGTGLFPNNSDNAITTNQIQFIFKALFYDLSFDLNGGESTPPQQQSLIEGALAIQVSEPTRGDYTFIGWNTAKDGSGQTWNFKSTVMPANNVILYAQWERNIDPVVNYTLRFDLNGGQGDAPTYQVLNEGEKVIKPDNPIREGYEFKGWNTMRDGSGQIWSFDSNTMPANDLVLYAQWIRNKLIDNPESSGSKNLPQTGDDNSVMVFSSLLFGTGLLLVFYSRKFRDCI